MEHDFLSIYNESIYFNIILSFFNIFSYFITIFFFSYLSLLSGGFLNDKSIINHKYSTPSIRNYLTENFLFFVSLFSLMITMINYLFGFYINIVGWILWSILIIFCSFKFYNRVSAKWIFFSSSIFIISLISVYILFWYMMNEQNNHIFFKFDLSNYEIHYKSFWSIYKPGDVNFNYLLFKDDFGHSIFVDNTIPYKRDLIYYYILYSIALSFWFGVLRKILQYHKLFNNIKL